MVGVWVLIGGGYAEGRRIAGEKSGLTGFSQGYVTGILNWPWVTTVNRFAKRQVGFNSWDRGVAVSEAEGYNKGLVAGYVLGSGAPDNAKKAYRAKLRQLANVHITGAWSSNADEAYLQQTGYVIALAAAGVRYGLIKQQ
jgi:hypothetical protein